MSDTEPIRPLKDVWLRPRRVFRELANQPIGAADALRLGLALDVVSEEWVLARAMAIASSMAAWSPQAMAATKRLFYRVCDLPYAEALQAGRDTNTLMRSFRRTR